MKADNQGLSKEERHAYWEKKQNEWLRDRRLRAEGKPTLHVKLGDFLKKGATDVRRSQ